MTPKLAWLSRHAPRLQQRRDLSAYVIRQPAFCRFLYVAEFWECALELTNGHPALIVGIMTPAQFNGLARLAWIRAEIPVIRPMTEPVTQRWTGQWMQCVPCGRDAGRWLKWTSTPQQVDADEGRFDSLNGRQLR